GPTAEVWRAPVDAEVAAFIGYTTILPLTTDRAAWLLPDPTDRAAWLSEGAPDASRGERHLALRRNALRQDPAGTLTGTVLRAVTVSDAVHLEVDVDGVGQVAALGDDLTAGAGDRLRLRLDPRGVAVLPGGPVRA